MNDGNVKDGTGRSCEKKDHVITVSETQVIWEREYANEFGISPGDNLDCVVRKIFNWMEGYRRENEEELSVLRHTIDNLQRKIAGSDEQ
jgi:hypothetical protein